MTTKSKFLIVAESVQSESIRTSINAQVVNAVVHECDEINDSIRRIKSDEYDCIFLHYSFLLKDNLRLYQHITIDRKLPVPIVAVVDEKNYCGAM